MAVHRPAACGGMHNCGAGAGLVGLAARIVWATPFETEESP